MRKLSRKADGFLTNNMFGVILAVISIAILIVAGVKLYGASKNTEKESAIALLDSLVGKVEIIREKKLEEDTPSFYDNLQGFKQKGDKWYIIGWDSSFPNRPDRCYFESCLCVCPRDRTTCQDEGVCRPFDYKTVSVSTSTTAGSYERGPDKDPSISIPENILRLKISFQAPKIKRFISIFRES